MTILLAIGRNYAKIDDTLAVADEALINMTITCMLLVSYVPKVLTTVLYLINYHVSLYTGKLYWTHNYSCLFVHFYIKLMIIWYFIMILTIYI